MSPLDALYAFEDLRARLLVPIHHGAFALSYEQLGGYVIFLLVLVVWPQGLTGRRAQT